MHLFHTTARGGSGLRRGGLVALTVPGLVLALAACGSGGVTPAPSASAATSSAAPSSAAPTAPATPTTTAAAPAATGGLSEVPTVPVTTAPAVPVSSPATVDGVTVTLGRVTAFTGAAQVPGELGGPAVAVPVTLRNGTGAAVSAGDVVVDLVGADGSPASPFTSGPAKPLSGTVAPGATVSGVYAFTLGQDARTGVSVTVSLRAGTPVALFTGSVAA